MITYFKTINGRITQIDQCEPGCWVHVVSPGQQEINSLIEEFELDPSYITAALDEEESSRIEKEDNKTLVIFDTPMIENNEKNVSFYTIPIGIIAAEKNVITISSSTNRIFDDFACGAVKDCNTEFKTKFVLQIMHRTATRFLQNLKQIDKMSGNIEKQLRKSMKNKELIQLLELQKSLVYFNTSLKANDVTLKKMSSGRFIKLYDEDRDLLEDVLIELNQALEMANIHLNILSSTMDAFASVISNNLNIVMKILASITIVISIPTIISSFYGMNVDFIPISTFWFPVGLSVLLMGVVSFFLYKKDMF